MEKKIQADTPLQNIAGYALIEQEVRKLKFGQVTLTFRVHNEKITDVLIQEFKKIRLDNLTKG